jgi:uncharacterized coiled-coil protein SlyX|tara:strand:+ start:2836 stop:2997 length:162 start_codon:yes stop_codon:yes gene_type:complete
MSYDDWGMNAQSIDDRINDLESRVEQIEKLVLKLQHQVDNIHPVQYNIIAKED